MKKRTAQQTLVIEYLARLVNDKRVTYGRTACLDANSVALCIYFTDKYLTSVEIHDDLHNLLDAVRDIFAVHPTRRAPMYNIAVNTLGARRVCSLSVLDVGDYEGATRERKRAPCVLVDAIIDSDEMVAGDASYSAHMSTTRYAYTQFYTFDKL